MYQNYNCPPPKPDKDCDCSQTPNFCPPPAPPPIPCMPPVPSVLEGQSLYEAMNNLTDRVNTCIATYNNVMANCYKTLHNLEHQAETNGAYYGRCDVWVEDGYNADEGSKYKIIHKKVVDRRGQPIRMQLAPAYGNTTNSKITQTIQSASKVALADKMVIAQPMGENGWYGLTIMNGAPVPSDNTNTDLYTMGFTRGGVLRTYSNTTEIDTLIHDEIENSMGVPGIIIQNGQVTDPSYQENIPQKDVQTARICIGQNYTTREVLILVVGSEGDPQTKGLTTATCAQILMGYGCTVAVELTEGNSVAATDKGLMMVDTGNINPEGYAFWYISRKCYYCNDYQKELAELYQNYGQCVWDGYINNKGLVDLNNRLQQEIQDRITGDNNLQQALNQEIQDRTNADSQLQNNIDAERTARETADTQLQNNINAEATARQQADSQQKANITAEQTAREQAIAAEASARQAEDTRLAGLIAALNEDITNIESDISELETKYNQLSESLSEQQSALTLLQQTVNTIQGTINDIQQSIANVTSSIDNIVNGTTTLPYLRLSGGTLTGAVSGPSFSMTNGTVAITPANATDIANKQYVDGQISSVQSQFDNYAPVSSLANYLPLSGGTMSGPVNMNNSSITGIPTPVNGTDAVNKAYVDSRPSGNSYTAGSGITISQNVISADTSVLATKAELGDYAPASSLANYLPLSGGTLSGALTGTSVAMQSGTVAATPVNATDIANKSYVDNADQAIQAQVTNISNGTTALPYVKKSGDTMTGVLTNSAQVIVGTSSANGTTVSGSEISINNGTNRIQLSLSENNEPTIKATEDDGVIIKPLHVTATEFEVSSATNTTLDVSLSNIGNIITNTTQDGSNALGLQTGSLHLQADSSNTPVTVNGIASTSGFDNGTNAASMNSLFNALYFYNEATELALTAAGGSNSTCNIVFTPICITLRTYTPLSASTQYTANVTTYINANPWLKSYFEYAPGYCFYGKADMCTPPASSGNDATSNIATTARIARSGSAGNFVYTLSIQSSYANAASYTIIQMFPTQTTVAPI